MQELVNVFLPRLRCWLEAIVKVREAKKDGWTSAQAANFQDLDLMLGA